MNSQEKKAYLMRYLYAKCRFQALSDEMIRIRSDAERITPMITDMPGGAQVSDRIANAVERLTACADELEQEAENMRQAMQEIYAVIRKVPDIQLQEILIRKYIDGLNLTQISKLMHYCTKQVYRKHKKALELISIPAVS